MTSEPSPDQGGPPQAGDSSDHYHNVLAQVDSDDDADDDPDYQDEPVEGEDDEYFDAEDGDIEFEVVIDDADVPDDDEDDEDDEDSDEDEDDGDADDGMQNAAQGIAALFRGGTTGILTRAQLMALLRNRDLGNALFGNGEDEDGEVEIFSRWGRRRPRQPKDPNRFPKVPSVEGRKLLRSGVFGDNDFTFKTRKHLARRVLDRELGLGDKVQRRINQGLLIQDLLPATKAEHIVHYDDPIYSGQFSDDGNFFFSCSQDFKVRMYDTSNPYNWKHYKTVSYPWGYWTLTDASLSPDNRWLAYTSISSLVSIAPTDPLDRGDPYTLDLDDGDRETNSWGLRSRGFGIWSVRFSGDGRELVAGTNAHSIVVYDIESRTVLHHVQGHEDDVNAVCFADKSSPHILYSGSDDGTIKVWDRRSMGDGREAGAFVGHTEGLTYIDSKGDGRYILSNGKDQCMKLWDLRTVMSTERFEQSNALQHTRNSGFDYRRDHYDEDDWDPHPNDNSVVTFRGHKVLRTLIRCHFSPPNATNSRYVYSGSADGKVYVWNMDATLADTIDVKEATKFTRPSDRRTRLYFEQQSGWSTTVRDASWHPNAPLLVASAWNGYNMARGTCSLHSFNDAEDDEGDLPMGRSVDENLRTNSQLYNRFSQES